MPKPMLSHGGLVKRAVRHPNLAISAYPAWLTTSTEGITVSHDNFSLACDQLSRTVDANQFERFRWARDEAPKLAHLVVLAQAAVEARDDFELTDEGSGGSLRRFVVKVHSFRIIAIAIKLAANRVEVQAEAIERSRFRVLAGAPISAPFEQVDGEWMAAALGELFARIQA